MTNWEIGLLLVAGLFGGLANSMAGGASLFTFPAMLSTGLSPIIANATNSFALLPGNGLGALSDRGRIPPASKTFVLTLLIAACGGIIGALLLLATSPRVFQLMVPALIGLATIIFLFAKQVRAALMALIHGTEHPKLRLALVLAAAIYNGFFGAGVGVVFIAVLLATGHEELRTANAFKNLLSFVSNIGGVIIFLASAKISWPHAGVMMVGAAAGGFLGGNLVKVLPPPLVRGIIGTCGCVMTAIYIYRFWL
ncbi:MAG: sulfite exporter TauE/SafE family protein [Alphaproteobacteria bacterium]|nr:sulfite exporter TauE/SafE family protein [Alphaproteobacteria bacterium]